MILTTDTAEYLEPDEATIQRVLRSLLEDLDEFAVLKENDYHFIQTVQNDSLTFCVEYRSGDHFYEMDNVTIETAISLFQSFRLGETTWKDDSRWVVPPEDSLRSITAVLESIQGETGRSPVEWLQLIKESGPKDNRALKAWLRTEHKLPRGISTVLSMVADPELQEVSRKLQLAKNLRALLDQSVAAIHNGEQQAIYDCRKKVEDVRAILETTENDQLKIWREPFNRIAEQFISKCQADIVSSTTISEGVVYLLKAGPFYKIGNSTDVSKRFNQIKLQLPYSVEKVHQIRTDDPRGVEFYWHKRFSNKRTNGEWFLLTDEDVAKFKSRSRM